MKNWKLNVLTLSCLAVLSACSSSGSGRACCDATVAPNAGAKPAATPATSTDVKPAETKPAETKPEASKPAEEAKAPEATKPAEEPKVPEATTPAETQPVAPEATKPAEEPKAPETTTPAETQPAEPEATKPAEEPKAPETAKPAAPAVSAPEVGADAQAKTFVDALAKSFAKDHSKGTMMDFGEDKFNGFIVNIDNDATKKNGEITLKTEHYNYNGRTPSTALTDYFKLDKFTTITLLNSPEDMKGFVGLRDLVRTDFPNVSGNSYMPSSKSRSVIGSRFGLGSYDGFAAVRFGVYTDRDNISYLFVHGKPGSRGFNGTYKGSAVYGKDGVYTGLQDAVTAVVSNKGGKQVVDVDIKVSNTKTWSFGGDVSGNVFEGTRGNIYTKGGFFGYSDLGGVFNITGGEDKGNHGVYGATSDDKTWKENRTK